MTADRTRREELVAEGRYSVASVDDGSTDYVLVAGDDEFPIDREDVDDLYAVVSRLRTLETDAEEAIDEVSLTCQECGTEWTYTGSSMYASCPNCEAEVPVEGIGP
ncbi:hypothetical protein ACFQGT_08980 [Natrialbaceae archaeon GCM10025810]|uniref:hypothetical protein n=1 Tax=Halovalidus salilacus TaxID=3075124 RepID=UPI00360F7316